MKVELDFEYDYPASTVWPILAAGDELKWVSAGDVGVEKTGNGVGMERKICWGGRSPTIYRLTALDNDTQTMTYSIEANEDLDIHDLTIRYQVSSLPGQRCQEHITFQYTLPEDAEATEIETLLRLSTEMAADNFRKRLDIDADQSE